MSYKYGITGFVELTKYNAKKYSYFDNFYWLKEYAILLYIWPYDTSNIIKHKNASFINIKAPNKKTPKICYEIVLPRYKRTLDDIKLSKDQEIIQIMLDLLSGVSFLHKKKIMHRDLKPANIMINDNGRAIIIDFSHAHRIRTNAFTLDKDVVTLSYRPPEVFAYERGAIGQYDEKIDMWSIGIILFEMVTNFKSHETITYGNDSDVEKKWSDSSVYMTEIKAYFDSRDTNFTHAKTYWSWITKMVKYNPDKRISAIEMYKIVKKFAIENNICFTVPSNGAKNIKHNVISYTKDLEKINEGLLEKCCVILVECRKICFMKFVSLKVSNVLAWFISKLIITNENYKVYTLSIAIIIDIVVYDNLRCLADIISLVPDIQHAELENTIMHIIQQYDKELFLYDLFKFTEDIDIICTKITDIQKNMQNSYQLHQNYENKIDDNKIKGYFTEYESDVSVIKDNEDEKTIDINEINIVEYYSESEYSNIESAIPKITDVSASNIKKKCFANKTNVNVDNKDNIDINTELFKEEDNDYYAAGESEELEELDEYKEQTDSTYSGGSCD